MFKMPVENLKLHDIISWAVWEKYGSMPVIGWMSDLNQIMIPKQVNAKKASFEEKKQISSKNDDMNEDQASSVIRKIFSECVDEFSSMQLNSDQSA